MNAHRRDPESVALAQGICGAILLAASGFIGSALLFGDPPARHVWLALTIVIFVTGAALLVHGAHRYQRKFHKNNEDPG